jgi:aerobic C4-dicarboxylate transport protein
MAAVPSPLTAPHAPPAPKPIYRTLYFQVLVAVAIGITLGHFYPKLGADMKPLGDAFIKLVKMIIAPVIFLTVVSGIAGMTNPRRSVASAARRWPTSSPSRRWR